MSLNCVHSLRNLFSEEEKRGEERRGEERRREEKRREEKRREEKRREEKRTSAFTVSSVRKDRDTLLTVKTFLGHGE